MAGAAIAAGSAGVAGAAMPAAGSGGMKSGMQPYKGVANSPCAARTMLNVAWYYNWMQSESEPCSDAKGGKFVPMIWGHTGDEQNAAAIQRSITSFVGKGYDFVLGFNEPDNSSQSNIPVAKAIELWPAFDNPAIQIGSPGTAANANPGQAWFKDFMNQLGANTKLDVDFLAIHWYGWNAGSCDAKASQLESYLKWAEAFPGNRPIWITEWGCLNQSAPDAATVVAFYKAAVAMFAKHPRLERYAWYPWATHCGLNNKDGSLSELGQAYADAPAYR
ncbi:MAG TPA: glycosyl hydrolase [Polyangiales bacterium]|nr:glycosyl hydrolase [Polyangiales bacterium]